MPDSALDGISFAVQHIPDIPRLSMGHVDSRSGISGDIPGAGQPETEFEARGCPAIGGYLAIPPATDQAGLRLRSGKAFELGPYLVVVDSSELSLRNAADPERRRLVRTPITGLVPAVLGRRYVLLSAFAVP